MRKDKYKRKRERAQERAKQKSAQSDLMPSEAITIEKKWQASEDANPERHKEKCGFRCKVIAIPKLSRSAFRN